MFSVRAMFDIKQMKLYIVFFLFWVENKPKPVVTQSPSFDKMYSGELVSFSCRVSSSSGWEYVLYNNATELTRGPNYTMNHPTTSNNGQYWCQAKRGETPFYTEKSDTKTLQFSGKPCWSHCVKIDLFMFREIHKHMSHPSVNMVTWLAHNEHFQC